MKTLLHINNRKPLAFVLLGLAILLAKPSAAQGDLLIFPKRVVFEGTRTRSETVNLSNTGKDTARYDISLVQIRMTEEGGFENITAPDSGQLFAEPYLRIFPRRVVLAPGESQTVRVQLTRTQELESGEYRSHLYFRSVPPVTPLGEESREEAEPTSVSIRLTPVYGITIPCIIRSGELSTRVDIAKLSLAKTNDKISLAIDLRRTGNGSVFGDISVIHISEQGKKTDVAKLKGLAVYTPGNLRRLHVELKRTEGIDYRSGKLSVVYSDQEKGKKGKLAEAELILQ